MCYGIVTYSGLKDTLGPGVKILNLQLTVVAGLVPRVLFSYILREEVPHNNDY